MPRRNRRPPRTDRRPIVRRTLLRVLLGLAMLAVGALVVAVRPDTPAHASVPPDFDRTPVATGLSSPVAFRFAPGNRILIAQQDGAVRLMENGVLRAAPMATLPAAATDERGLLGIELDPGFATNGYLYAAYTNTDNFDRLSRFTVTGDTIDLGSEQILLKSAQPAAVFHHGGEIRFGPDGMLYWSLGMNLYNPNSQNLGVLEGKILRIKADGSIPADNPFVGVPGAEPAIWAYGLRNVFRFDLVPDGPNAGKPLAGDVGGSLFEEINLIGKGANYGWPAAEGPCNNCGYAAPAFSYAHTPPPASAGSISAVEVYHGDVFPAQYDNAVFYADYTRNFVKYLIMDETFTSVISDNDFDLNAGTPVQLTTGPDGYLYQLNIYPGELYRIGPSGGNRAPTAVATAQPSDGLAPLATAFSSAGSGDPDGTPITYAWDFKDGTTSTEPNPSHTFTLNGVYDVTLTVSDGSKTATAIRRVTVGNRHPTGTITAPTDDQLYNAGNVIQYAGTATDPEDGALHESAFSWKVIFHHADHVHPFLGPIGGVDSGSFTVPRNADNLATTWYEIQLTVHDSQGLTQVSSVAIRPRLAELTFDTQPPGLEYSIDGVPHRGPHTETGVVGVDRVVSTTSPQFLAGKQYEFGNWSDGEAQTHTIRTPATATGYTATLHQVGRPPAPWVSDDIGARTQAGTSAFDDGTFTIGGGGNDVWGTTDELRLVHRPLNGDGSITARVRQQSNTNGWAKSGVMIKESTTPGSPYAAVAITPDNGLHFQYNFNGDTGTQPYALPNGWMRLTRAGDVITAFRSADGESWIAIGSATVAMTTAVEIGLFVSAHAGGVLNETVFDNVTVAEPSGGGPLPAPWQQADIGGATPAGSAGYIAATSTYTVSGGGTDVWGQADQSSYVSQTLPGDGSIVARVTSQDDTDEWAKAGIMVKQSTTAGSPYAAMLVTPDHGALFQADFTASTAGGAVTPPNAWLKLTRTGTTVSGYRSADGTTWTLVGRRDVALSGAVTVGMFVSAHNGGASLGKATFDHVSVVAAPGVPPPWTSADVGAPALAGSANATGGTFTVTGAGTDVWGTADQFRFVHQPLDGDGTVITRVTGQEDTNPWAKSGIMIKESAAAGAPYAGLMVTPDNGIHLQTTGQHDISGGTVATPIWLKLTRTGSTFTAYRSANGTTWTRIGSQTVTMAGPARAGLFVTSHNAGALNTTTFTNVSVTAGGGALPAGWSHGDVGAAAPPGGASESNGTFTLAGGGADIWGEVDEFHYAHRTLPAGGTIVARVVSQENTSPWAKSGVMIKSSASAGAPYTALMVTPDNGVHLQSNFNSDQAGGTGTAPVWLKLIRSGGTVTASRSANGTTWTEVGTRPLTGAATIGLFVTSHSTGDLNTTVFDNVTVS